MSKNNFVEQFFGIKHIFKIFLAIALSLMIINFSLPANAAPDVSSYVGSDPICDGNVGTQYQPIQASNVSNVSEISGNLYLRNDGTVWYSGDNIYGQAGQGYTSIEVSNVQVPGLTGMTAVYSTPFSSYALRSDGVLFAWGWNNFGELGDGTTILRDTPVQVATNVTDMVAKNRSVAYIRNDGTVWVAGTNESGELGNGTTNSVANPNFVQATGLTGITKIAPSLLGFSALRNDNTLWVWGGSTYGSLVLPGISSTPQQQTQIPGTITDLIDGGSYQTFVIVNGNDYWAWGLRNDLLGNPAATTSTSQALLDVVASPADFPLITGNVSTQFLVDTTGRVWSNTVTNDVRGGFFGIYQPPYNVDPATGFTEVQLPAGVVIDRTDNTGGSPRFIDTNDNVWSWGFSGFSNPSLATSNSGNIFKQHPTINDIVRADTGGSTISTMIIDNTGQVIMCGGNTNGQFGTGTTDPLYRDGNPQVISGVGSAIDGATMGGSVIINSADEVWVWGQVAGAVRTPTELTNFGGLGATKVRTMNLSSDAGFLLLTNSNTLYAHEMAGASGLDVRTTIDTDVVDIDCSQWSCAYLKNDGSVRFVGQNSTGLYGTAASTSQSDPFTLVTGLPANITQIELTHSVPSPAALFMRTSSGDVYGMGSGASLGDGDPLFANKNTPQLILSGVEEIGSASSNTFARMADGTVRSWGITPRNGHGTDVINTPTEVPYISNAQPGFFRGTTAFAPIIQADVDDPITTAETASITYSCNDAVESTTTTCTFQLPTGRVLPAVFKMSVGNATPAGTCSQTLAGAVTCLTVPVGSFVGAGDVESQDIFTQISNEAITDSGEDANVYLASGDADNDGISNEDELTNTNTDPFNPDTDGDGLPDGWENDNGFDPNDPTGDNGANGDPDGDGLLNSGEYLTQHDPNDVDSDSTYTTTVDENDNTTNDCDEDIDGDGISNCDEIANNLDPLFANTDTDGDGIPDEWEIANGLDPNDPNDAGLDLDGDGATNLQEYTLGTDPNDADSDSIRTPGVDENDNTVNDCDEDLDNDGLTNCAEFTAGTDPLNSDSDGDGIPDGFELNNGLNPLDPNDSSLDPDNDGLTNLQESQNNTNPNSADTDGDGLPDGWEVDNGLDPTSADGVNGADGDLDGDGLTNIWEFRIGHNANDADSDNSTTSTNEDNNSINDCNEDADADGSTNCEEISAGTDPLDSSSRPATTPTTNVTPRTGALPLTIAGATTVAIISGGFLINQKRKKMNVKIK